MEEETQIKINDIVSAFNNLDVGYGNIIVGVSKAMEDIHALILKHQRNQQPPLVSETTLYSILTIVGREVELHTKNGDLYSGIFYVPRVKPDIGIQLKRCKLPNGIIVDTKDIALEEISKLVAKGITILVDDLEWNLLKTDDEKDQQQELNYHIDIEKISSGEDVRSSLIIRNIPKRYTTEMLVAEFTEIQPGTFDFIHLPFTGKSRNRNNGYAFINMVSASKIIGFYQAFEGKKWGQLNSEKAASLEYARLQGTDAHITEYLMKNPDPQTVDKLIRPTLFLSERQYQEESVRYGNFNVRIREPEPSSSGDMVVDNFKENSDQKN